MNAQELQPAAQLAGISETDLNTLVNSERTARTQSQIDFLRGINNLIRSFGQRVTQDDLVIQ